MDPAIADLARESKTRDNLAVRRIVLITMAGAGILVAACGSATSEALTGAEPDVSLSAQKRMAALGAEIAGLSRAAEFESFAAGIDGEAGLVVGSPGSPGAGFGEPPIAPAWSTIKVPIALAVLQTFGGPDGLSAEQKAGMERALTLSDNEAAAELFSDLSTQGVAADAVTEILRSAGDGKTRVSTVGRDGFSTYGQTEWSLGRQHEFLSALVGGCLVDRASSQYVLDLMGRVTSDTWGLGAVGHPARWKGGWGPDPDGNYLLRQMGVVNLDGEPLLVTLAVQPADGTFASGQTQATKLAKWALKHAAGMARRPAAC